MTDLESPSAAPAADARLRTQVAEAMVRQAELLRQKEAAEQALALVQAEKQALARKLQDLDAELGETLVAAAQSAATHRAVLAELSQRAAQLEKDLAARTAREAAQVSGGEAPKTKLSGRIASLEAEKGALVQKLAAVENARDSALSEAAQRGETQRVLAQRLEADAAAHKEREAHLRDELTRSASAEREASQAAEASRAELLKQKTEAGQALSLVQTEKEALARKLLDRAASRTSLSGRVAALEVEKQALVQRLSVVESDRDSALSEAARREEAQRGLVQRLEAEAAAQKEREARLREEWTRSTEREATQAAEASRAELLKQKTESEQALAVAQNEKQALARKLKDLEADLVARAVREADLVRDRAAAKANLSERIAALEAEKEALVQKLSVVETREAARLRDRETSKNKLSGRIAGLEMEKAALAQKLSALESDRDSAVSEAARREETQLHAIAEQRARAERLEAEAAAHKEFEARLTEDGARSRAGLVERIGRLETEAAQALRTFGELLAKIAEGEQALAQARGEAKEASETLARAEQGHAQALAEAVRAREEALRVSLAQQIARTEATAAAGESARAELVAQHVEGVRALEADHSMVLAEAGKRKDALRQSLDAERQRVEQLEKDIEEGARLRAGLLEQVGRLEAEVGLAQKTLAELSADRTEGERALARARDEAKEAFEKLTEVERGHAQAVAEALRAQDEFRVSLAEQVSRAEAAEAAAESARTQLVAQQAEGERALESVRAESEARFAEVDTLRQALDAERQRAEQLEKDIEAFFEGEAKRIREWETSRAEWSDRIRLLEDAAAESGTAQADLLARMIETEQTLASLQAERETLATRLSEVEGERDRAQAAVALRESTHRADLEEPGTPAEVWEAARTELLARIARLEANEALADKARSELVSRKRDSDRALAAAQAERAALLKKLAIAEGERDKG